MIKNLHISQIDTHFANGTYPIEFFFFYPHKIETSTIRKALETASKIFWPAFGTYEQGIIHKQKFIEEKFIAEKTINEPFNQNQTENQIYNTHKSSNPEAIERLFFISVFQYPNGTALIPKLSHLAGDGYSYFYFLMVLSALASSRSTLKKWTIYYAYKPLSTRNVLRSFRFQQQFENIIQPSDNLDLVYMQLPKKQVKQHIKNCLAKHQITISTNDVICSYILKKFNDLSLFSESIELTMPVDIRNHIKEYGPKYFGNALLFSRNSYNINDIKNMSVEKLAAEIRKSAPEINKVNYIDYLKSIEAQIEKGEYSGLRPFDPDKGCLVTNLSKLPTNKLNFGTGRPEIVSTITKGKNSVAVLSDKDNFILRMMY
ncbi:MAG: hypothetical protein H6627_04135 [Calditrichae bacterium]|nr:hypothetical protein [Calditrichota bacterium]MCB9057729.1 hypothetical protein [Calditrichia bacterium]